MRLGSVGSKFLIFLEKLDNNLFEDFYVGLNSLDRKRMIIFIEDRFVLKMLGMLFKSKLSFDCERKLFVYDL